MNPEEVRNKMLKEEWKSESRTIGTDTEALLVDNKFLIAPKKEGDRLHIFIACEKSIGIVSENKYQERLREDDSAGIFGVLHRRISEAQPITWLGNQYRISTILENKVTHIIVFSRRQPILERLDVTGDRHIGDIVQQNWNSGVRWHST